MRPFAAFSSEEKHKKCLKMQLIRGWRVDGTSPQRRRAQVRRIAPASFEPLAYAIFGEMNRKVQTTGRVPWLGCAMRGLKTASFTTKRRAK
jgi:hypothetical protein